GLTCVAHIMDPQLCALLREREFETHSARRMRLEFFNLFELGARVLLEDYDFSRLAGSAKAPPNIVVIGLGRLGEALVVAGARQWWLAEDREGREGRRLGVILVDANAGRIADSLRARHPGLDKTCALTVREMDVRGAEFIRANLLGPEGDGSGRAIVF